MYRDLGLTPFEIASTGRLVKTDYATLAASGGSEDASIIFDFALAAGKPARAKFDPRDIGDRLIRARNATLRAAGNALERVPERIRPKIRHRDRHSD